jgi:hypothetical protein
MMDRLQNRVAATARRDGQPSQSAVLNDVWRGPSAQLQQTNVTHNIAEVLNFHLYFLQMPAAAFSKTEATA